MKNETWNTINGRVNQMEKNPWTQRQATSEGQSELNENNVQDLWHKNHKSKSSGHWHLKGKRERGKKNLLKK